jgi:hypothetical protein
MIFSLDLLPGGRVCDLSLILRAEPDRFIGQMTVYGGRSSARVVGMVI